MRAGGGGEAGARGRASALRGARGGGLQTALSPILVCAHHSLAPLARTRGARGDRSMSRAPPAATPAAARLAAGDADGAVDIAMAAVKADESE